MIDADMAPAAGGVVDDLDLCGLPDELRHVPRFPLHVLVIVAARGADNFSAHEQIDMEDAGIPTTSNQKVNRLVVDLEIGRMQFTDCAVAAMERRRQRLAEIPRQPRLARQRAWRWTVAEGGSRRRPTCGISRALEISEHLDVGNDFVEDATNAQRRAQDHIGTFLVPFRGRENLEALPVGVDGERIGPKVPGILVEEQVRPPLIGRHRFRRLRCIHGE